MENDRYSRQTILPEITEEGQKKLSAAHILCIGAGGLGCPALLYLAAAGVGHLGIVDFDTVEESNLQRQILFSTDQTGQNKAAAARDKLIALNPDIEVTAYTEELTEGNAENIFSGYDIIIDGTDNFAAKFLINDTAIKCGKPLIYGSISGFEGQVSVFNLHGGPCYRCLYPAPPQSYVPNCAEAGVIGAVAGLVGTQQALQAIQVAVADKSFAPLTGKLWMIDAHDMQTQCLTLPKNPFCSVCCQPKDKIVLEYSSPVCGLISEVTPEQARENRQAVFIDVRETHEWQAGHIAEAQHIPLSLLSQNNIPDLPRDCDLVLYCRSGKRSVTAARILLADGYMNVYSMAGGYEAWKHLENHS
ncbi:MAG: molybdenum cofactor biosynthesis protein MoeB [Alphaproteobacteria bacterium]|nr:MAG: molybdenum cofactor biosynthesis protein MoeB [Alphaproteobacteria bacterium]